MFQLTPNLWVTQSKLYHTNSGILNDGKQAGLIDPGLFPDELEAIASFLAAQDSAPEAIILTHGHWDHILGPERFPGVKTIAQANYLAEVSGEYDTFIRRQIEKWEQECGLEREQPFVIPRPDETFDETMTMTVGKLALRLIHAPGHAADQLVVYQPDGATLWAADMLSDLEIPFVSHSLAAYERTLAMLSAMEVQTLVPGHGHAAADRAEIHARVSDDIAYLAELRDKVEQAIREGKTAKDTVEACAAMRFRHPQENKGPHRLNVESAYLELGGEADPTKVGWNQSLGE